MSMPIRRRRRLVLALAGAAVIGVGIVGVTLGVHDENFQLEGNASAADLSFVDIDKTGNTTTTTPGTLSGTFAGAYDWDSLFDISGVAAPGNALGTVTGVKATLPGDFTAASFIKDFGNTGTTFLTSDSTTFATGSKDTLPISGWQCNRDNNVNSKTDIINGYAAIAERGASKILYFGLEKDVDNGDNNVGFWLLQDGTVNCSSPGGAVTFTGAHMEGDLFVVSAFTNGGGVSDVTVYQWVNDADPKAGLQPGINPTPILVGADCLDTATSGDADKACATVNGKAVQMPWLSADGGAVNAIKKSPNFFEGAINLSAFTEFSDRCFGDFVLNTRSSQELGATIFDYVRGDLNTCRPSLGIVKTPDSGSYFAGESFSWSVNVTNAGNGAATNAVVTDTIPAGLTIGSPTYDMDPNTAGGTGACSVSGQLVTCTIPTIAASDGNTTGAEPDVARVTIPVTVTLAAFGTSTDGCVPVNNTATVTVGTTSASDTGAVTVCRLSVEKSAATTYDRDFDWTIDKSVDPTSASLFDGQDAQFGYTIVATKSDPIDSNFAVSGDIVISNPAGMAATVSSVTDAIPTIDPISVSCPSSTVPANGTLTCTYSSALPDKTARTNTATVVAYGVTYSDDADVTFGDPTNTTDDSDSVNDTIDAGDFGPISSTTTHTYNQTYDCSGITYTDGVGSKTIPNTATLVDDGDADGASVTITCYRLSVEKSAATTYDRDFDWTIDKSVSESEITLQADASTSVTYTVTATKSAPTDSNFAVSGDIVISNPAGMAATVTSVSDSITGIGALDVSCPSSTVPANGTLTCTYSSALPDKTARTNTATVVAYGVTYSDDADVAFGAAANTTDNCAAVTDSLQGSLGTTCATRTWTYSRTIGPYASCGDYRVNNTATVTAEDSRVEDSDSASVLVHVVGCGNLFHTGTTCDQYYLGAPVSGQAGMGIDAIQYSVKQNKISQVNPGVFFYYTDVTATGSSASVVVDQTPPGSFNHAMSVQNNNQVRVFDQNCNSYSDFTFTIANGDVTVTINGTTSGNDYIVSVKYDPTNLVGLTKPGSSPVTYSFATTFGGGTFGADTLNLTRK